MYPQQSNGLHVLVNKGVWMQIFVFLIKKINNWESTDTVLTLSSISVELVMQINFELIPW